MATRTPYTSAALEVLTSANFEKMPKGEIGYAEATADQNNIPDTATDLTGLTLTITVGSSRRIRLGCKLRFSADADLAGIVEVYKNGALFDQMGRLTHAINEQFTITATTEDAPAAGTHTYKLVAYTGQATDTMDLKASSTNVARFWIDDVGPAFS